ncbi:MAG: YdbH domain-containing protein [Hyphomonadaceae bacterium]|nr:YdbH domain-containing protein [Hyphomonadaceae bacterium]
MDQPRNPDEDAPRRRRSPTHATALVLGVGAVALGAIWLFRAPIAGAAMRQALAGAGVESAFRVTELDFGGVALEDVRLGAEGAPDATMRRARMDLSWAPLPRVGRIRMEGAMLRARLDERGFSLGSLDPLLRRGDGGERALPDITLEIVDGRGLVETPFGALALSAETHGALRRDFVGDVRLARTSLQKGENALADAEGALALRTREGALHGVLQVAAGAARLPGVSVSNARIDAEFATDLALRGRATGRIAAASLSAGAMTLDSLRGEVSLASLQDGSWAGEGSVRADASGDGQWNAPDTEVRATLALRDAPALSGAVRTPHFALTRSGRAALADAWPSLGAFPFGPLLAASRDATIAALSDAALDAPFALAAQSLAVPSLEVAGASGGRIRLQPRQGGAPLLTINLQDLRATGAGVIETSGGGLPSVRIDAPTFRLERGALTARADVSVPDYRANGAALQAPALAVTLDHANGRGAARLRGEAIMSGPMGGAHVEGLVAPLDLAVAWGDGLRIAPQEGRCLALRFASLALPALTFVDGAAPICPEGGAFYATDGEGVVTGGFSMAATTWSGRMGEEHAAQLRMQGVRGALSGVGGRLELGALVQSPTLDIRFGPDRTMRAEAPRLDAHLVATADGWRATGAIAAGVLEDATLPARVTEIAGRWNAAPHGGGAVVRFEGGAARLTSRETVSATDSRPAFNPMRVAGAAATIQDGRVDATGVIALEEGARQLARFEATHAFESGAGEATIRTDDLAFGARLQPFEITERARGVVENVRGPAAATIHAHWTPDAFAADGSVRLDNMSLATSTLPIIEGVSGEIRFSDLLNPETPPSQRLTVALLNPGVAVRDGVIDFQLLDAGRVVIERAEWPFAQGVLAVAPITIALGAEETRFSLTLAHVDVETLLAELKVPDLAATGRVGGSFPLVLTPEAAKVENGTLQAETGGTIAYAGRAGEEMRGAARLAFDALKQFRYDNLSLVLNGDLAGDLLTEIRFSGASRASVDLPGVSQGPLRAELAGVPFVFNVSVRAPFRRLGELAAGAFDPKRALQQSREAEQAPSDSGQDIDLNAPPTR